jgi:hypothetical protein
MQTQQNHTKLACMGMAICGDLEFGGSNNNNEIQDMTVGSSTLQTSKTKS